MNQLPLEKRVQILNMLVECVSIRSITRITGCSKNTVIKLLVEAGKACEMFHHENVKGVTSRRVQCDEIWSYVYSKAKNVPVGMEGSAGDIWTWVGMDADTKLIISWYVGNRDADSAYDFMQDIASRLANRVQLTTDGLASYLEAVEDSFGASIDFAQLVKIYGTDHTFEQKTARKYSPAEYVTSKKTTVTGHPDPKYVSTSYIERQNLTIRTHIKRFARLTNAFSKKVENHCHAVALHFVYYNYVRIHSTLRVTPAMEAGLTKKLWNIKDIVTLIDEYNAKKK